MTTLRFTGLTLNQLRKKYDPQIIDKALITAFNKATGKAKTTASAEARKIYDIKAADVNKRASVRKTNGKPLTRWLLFQGPGEGLEKFKPTARKVRVNGRVYKGVAVRVRKDRGRKLVGSGFTGNIANGLKVFARKATARLPIRKLTGPSVPHMVGKKVVELATVERFRREVDIEFDRAMQYHLGKTK